MRNVGKGRRWRGLDGVSRRALLAAAGSVLVTPLWAQSLPTNGQVAAGSVSIGAPTAGSLTIRQSSGRGIINWQGFSVGQGNSVTFQQPSARSATLNRVTGSATSTIAGRIGANGQVYLVNPNGVQITSTGRVDTAGFTASSLAITDGDFLAGTDNFVGNGSSKAVVNRGKIRVKQHGTVMLLGGRVVNSGTIIAPGGRVGLGAGEHIAVDVEGDGFLTVSVPTANASSTRALIADTGRIQAHNGRVELRAATSADVARAAIEVTGSIEAGSVRQTGNGVTFGGAPPSVAAPRWQSRRHLASAARGASSRAVVIGGGPGGSVTVAGKINVSRSAKRAGGTVDISGSSVTLAGDIVANGVRGGTISVTGNTIALDAASLDASGTRSGGSITIGGSPHGAGPLADATTTTIDAASVLRADALGNGNGGTVTVWSNGLTTFAGAISAEGGPLGGNGGSVETSGGTVDFTGARVTTRAALGTTGTWLVDPVTLTVDAASAATISSNLATTDVTLTTGAASASGIGVQSSGEGDIIVDAAISWSAATTLTLSAYDNIAVNAPITLGGGGALALNAAGSLTIDAAVKVEGAGSVSLGAGYDTTTVPGTSLLELSFGLTGAGFTGSLSYLDPNGNPLSSSAGGALTINGQSYTLLYSMGEVQNINAGVAGNYALANSLDAGTTANWTPIGQSSAFTGTFEGLGHTISNLTISTPNDALVGFFGKTSGTLRDVGLTGGTVSGSTEVGGLAGYVSGGSIANAYATGTVTVASSSGGGLVGALDAGSITNAYATGAVRGAIYSLDVGGFLGLESADSSITNAYATGAVSADSGSGFVGGLVGFQYGSVKNAYATGATSGSAYVGGLVGASNGGSITNAYATGAVSGSSDVGGLVGFAYRSSVTSGYYDSSTTGEAPGTQTDGSVGLTTAQLQGLAALPNSGTIIDSNHLGAAFAGGASGLYPYLTQFFPGGVQAVSGYAYADAGATPAAGTVGVIGGGQSFGSASIGANGYYYTFGPAGSVATNAALLVYTTNAATLTVATGGANQANVNLYGNAITVPTSATSLASLGGVSGAFGMAKSAALQADGNIAGAIAAIDNAAGVGLVSSGAGFAVDTPVSTGNTFFVQTTAAGAPITVSKSITVASGGALGLDAAGALTIDAAVKVDGAGSVSLAAGYDTTTVPGTPLLELSFGLTASGFTGALTYLDAKGAPLASSAGGKFSINGQIYTLIYTMAELDAIDGVNAVDGSELQTYGSGLAGNYALAQDLDASNISYGQALVGSATVSFVGSFEGLGHAISNLTIADTNSYDSVGLFGTNSGTIRNLRLIAATVSGGFNAAVGGLAGANYAPAGTASIVNASVTGTVTDAQGAYVGGLVGLNESAGGDATIKNARTNATVTGGQVGGQSVDVGGLVGLNMSGSGSATIMGAYATGAVQAGDDAIAGGLVGYSLAEGSGSSATITGAYATGTVTGTSFAVLGGLVGESNGSDSGIVSVSNAFATGAVTAGSDSTVGGLVGVNQGVFAGTASIANVYATGAVTASSGFGTGGLVGENQGSFGGTASVSNAFATGAVTGHARGGLIGSNLSYPGTSYAGSTPVTDAYWDTQTTGVAVGCGCASGTGLTTAQLQANLPSGFHSSVWGTGAGLYPYLKAFYAETPQAISGIAYTDSGVTPLASGAGGAQYVFADVAGAGAAQATTGANGYYYILEPAGTFAANGTATLTYTTQDNTPGGTVTGATLISATGTTARLDIWAHTLIAPTTSTSLAAVEANGPTSASALLAFDNGADQRLLDAAAAGSSFAGTGSLSRAGYIATNAAGFAIDAAVRANGLYVMTTAGPITVTAAQTITGKNGLTLDSASTLTVDAPITLRRGASLALNAAGALVFDPSITIDGAGSVTLSYNTASPADLSFAAGDTITFANADGSAATAPVAGQSLTINGAAYTLVYTMAELDAIDGRSAVDGTKVNTYGTGLSGNYALANNLDASSVIYANALIGTFKRGIPFSGVFEGLGHTISSLTIDAGTVHVEDGLFSSIFGATVRDLGLVGGSVRGSLAVGGLAALATNSTIYAVYDTGAVIGLSSSDAVGGLVGQVLGGTILSSHASGPVTDADTSAPFFPGQFGGLVGADIGGIIQQSYATGSVTVSSPDALIGGLVGWDVQGAVSQSYATGAVTATGAPTGNDLDVVGGFVGLNTGGSISQSFAMGAVTGTANPNVLVGGFAGGNSAGGALMQVYAVGAVSGGGITGGLVGVDGTPGTNDGSTVAAGYFDTSTTGQTAGIGQDINGQAVVGLATAALQGTLPAGFTSGWATGANLFPYLTSLFPNGVQALSGVAYQNAGATAAASGVNGPVYVTAATSGAVFGQATTGANGYYYIFGQAGWLAAGTGVAAYTTADVATGVADAVTFAVSSGALNTRGVNIDGGWLLEKAGSIATLSSLDTAYASTVGVLAPSAFPLANREIESSAATFSIDAPIATETLALRATGSVVQDPTAAIAAIELLLEGPGGAFSLTANGNVFLALAADTGAVAVVDSVALDIASVADASGKAAVGVAGSAATLLSVIDNGGPITLVEGGVASGGAILIAANGAFTNDVGTAALATGNGAGFDIYSQVSGNVTGVLPSDVFRGIVATNWYNDAFDFTTDAFATAVPTGNYFVYGYAAALTPALGGLATSVYDGTTAAPTANLSIGSDGLLGGDSATLTLAGAAYDTPNVGSGKTVTASGITFLSNPNNYVLAATTASAAIGTIDPAALTVTADSTTKTYGSTLSFAGTEFTAQGLVGSDSIASVTLASAGAAASAGVNGGVPYAITASNAVGNGLSNYAITYLNGSLTVTANAPTFQTGVFGGAGTSFANQNTYWFVKTPTDTIVTITLGPPTGGVSVEGAFQPSVASVTTASVQTQNGVNPIVTGSIDPSQPAADQTHCYIVPPGTLQCPGGSAQR
jgi:filamentous hemagglutinin family protein